MAAMVLRSVSSDTENRLSTATLAKRRWLMSWFSRPSRSAGVSITAGSNCAPMRWRNCSSWLRCAWSNSAREIGWPATVASSGSLRMKLS
ncbi:hypothetical protein D3C72_1735780 [compost metagenome]